MPSRMKLSKFWTAEDRKQYRDAIDNSGAQKAEEDCVTKTPNNEGGYDISYSSTCFHNALEKAAKKLEDVWTE